MQGAEDKSDLIEVVFGLMRQIRREVKGSSRGDLGDLSMPQFRTLLIVRRRAGASLSEVAERMELTPAACSHMIESLVQRGLVSRQASEEDRRRIELRLTEAGEALLAAHHEAARARFAERLAPLDERERQIVAEATAILRRVLQHDEDGCHGR